MNIEELNIIRKDLAKIYITGFIIVVLTLLLGELFLTFAVAIIMYIIIKLITKDEVRDYKKNFKNYFVLTSLQENFQEVYYKPDKGIPDYVIEATGMIHMGRQYSSNDYIYAKYENLTFEQADVLMQDTKRDSNGNYKKITLFKGRWIIFDFNKTFKSNVQISQVGFNTSKAEMFLGKKENLYKKIKMESVAFNSMFNVYAQNEHDAFYLLTPTIMENILNLSIQNNGKLLFCFVDSKLHIGLYNNHDAFEPSSVFKPINENEVKFQISNDIKKITQFIDALNLNDDLFISN